jgi:hypothetical protein
LEESSVVAAASNQLEFWYREVVSKQLFKTPKNSSGLILYNGDPSKLALLFLETKQKIPHQYREYY